MYGSAIPRVTSKHPGPQPPPEISHCDCAGVNCTQKKAWRPLDGGLESSDYYEELRQFAWIDLRRKEATHVVPAVYWERETGHRSPASGIFFWHLVNQ